MVLNYLELLHPRNKLTLKELSQKLAMPLALLSGQRCQTILKLSSSSMKLSSSMCVFQIASLLKQSRRGYHLAPIELMAYPDNSKLCIVAMLREYLARTQDLCKYQDQLLLSYQKLHHPITKDTLARWLRDILNKSEVDTELFSAHSIRSASTSTAARRGLPVDVTMKPAGWSAVSTFTRFYKKAPKQNWGQTLLQ